jgi:hypothetical protein
VPWESNKEDITTAIISTGPFLNHWTRTSANLVILSDVVKIKPTLCHFYFCYLQQNMGNDPFANSFHQFKFGKYN